MLTRTLLRCRFRRPRRRRSIESLPLSSPRYHAALRIPPFPYPSMPRPVPARAIPRDSLYCLRYSRPGRCIASRCCWVVIVLVLASAKKSVRSFVRQLRDRWVGLGCELETGVGGGWVYRVSLICRRTNELYFMAVLICKPSRPSAWDSLVNMSTQRGGLPGRNKYSCTGVHVDAAIGESTSRIPGSLATIPS